MNDERRTNPGDMELDRILAAEEPLIPSSGFLASVMERVHEEAVAPAPIPFPWKRALPGMVFAVAVLGWGGFELARAGVAAMTTVPLTLPQISAAMIGPLQQTGWVAGALAVSLASWILSRRMVGRLG
jgi:hypothetical protein